MSLYNCSLYVKDLEDTARSIKYWDELKNTSVLVAGASGLIGSYIVDVLLTVNRLFDTNIMILALGRSQNRLEKRFEGIKTDQLVYVEHDIQKPFESDLKVDYIIHAASNAYPAAFENDPVGTMMSNMTGTFQLLEYARKCASKKFLFVSSGEIYGQYDGVSTAYDENYCGYIDFLQPRSCYPSSKRAAETLCCSYHKQYGIDVVIVRPCHVYGPNTTSSDNRATVQFIDNILNGSDIILKSAGNQLRSYCYIADCVSAIFTILFRGASGEAYNIANPDARVTIAQFAEIAAKQAKKKVVFITPDQKDLAERSPISRQVLDSNKLENLGWTGRFTVSKGIEHTLKILTQEKDLI